MTIPFASFALPVVAAVAGVAAIAAPVLLHLLSRQRYRVVEWAAMRFLELEPHRQRRRIDHWPLLLARIVCLVLILAGMCATAPWAESLWQNVSPGPPEFAINAPRTHHIIVVDASMSMTAEANGRKRFDKARDQARALLEAGNPGDGFSLVVLNGPAQVVIPGPANDAAKLLSELDAVSVSHAAADLGQALTAIADLVARSPRTYPRRQVTIISDHQRSTWAGALPSGDKPAPELWQKILGRAEVAVVDVAAGDVDNLAVTDLTLADPLPLVDSPATVTVTVQNFSKSDRRGTRVELLLARPSKSGSEPALLPVEQKIIDAIAPGERATLTFALDGRSQFREAGPHLVQAKLVDADELTVDDSRTLAFDVRAGVSIVIVNGQSAEQPLRRASGYLVAALAPGGAILPGNPVRVRELSLAEFSDAAIGDLTKADGVILCDVPSLTPSQVARLEALLKRGGGIVLGLGPQSHANLNALNRQLFDDGKGLLPAKLRELSPRLKPDDPGLRLATDDDSYRRPPLDAFRDDNARGGLTAVPFKQYVRVERDPRSRRLLAFVPATATAAPGEADAALLEMPRHRGKVLLFTTTWNSEWTDWPLLPSYLPFAHELVRHIAASPDRHTVRVGDAIEEFLPDSAYGLTATLRGPDGSSQRLPVASSEEGLSIRSLETPLAGLYRLKFPGRPDTVFAVNPTDRGPAGSESDLRRLESAELGAVSPAIQVVASVDQIRLQADDGSGLAVATPRPHGPTIARWLLTLALIAIAVELILAWASGPSRGMAPLTRTDEAVRGSRWSHLAALVPLGLLGVVLGTLIHHASTGEFLGFVPHGWRGTIERAVGVPASAPGEGIRWRLESFLVYLKSATADRRVQMGLAAAFVVLVGWIYHRENRAVGRRRRLIVPALLRIGIIAALLYALLPQIRLAFDREGWPDIVILIDDSASMATVDALTDPSEREAARKLLGGEIDRLALAKALIGNDRNGWIARLLEEKQVKVHVSTIGEQLTPLGSADRIEEGALVIAESKKPAATGETSRLGDGIHGTLRSFRGGSLAAMIVLTDGQVTAGESLVMAGREAARAGVPLYFVGLGDAVSAPDYSLGDLRADDTVTKGDELVFDARLSAKGPIPNGNVNVILSELIDGKPVERARTSIRPDPAGKPVPVRLQHVPAEVGEKTYVIEVAAAAGERELTNNRIERIVLVTESKRLAVLLIDGYPRYEYRYVKDWLERQAEANQGPKSIALSTLPLAASKDFSLLDRSALRTIPTRDELFQFDAVIFGDVDPAQVPVQLLADLRDYVTVKGGGLLVVAGEQATPHKLFDTPLGELLPVLPSGSPRPTNEQQPLTEGYRPRLTPIGQSHALFRFASEDAANTQIWANLKPFFWHATGYKRKLAAEVLAVHPDKPSIDAPGENHPLALQQFVGAGRVVFFGFDETWRWRFRDDEAKFGQFWLQAVRLLGRNRVRRIELRTDRQSAYRTGEPMTITVRFPDDAAPPEATVPIRVAVERTNLPGRAAETETQTLQLAKVDGSRATYEGTIVRTVPGEYRMRLVSPEPRGVPPRADAKVLPPPGERERLDRNDADMQKAAAESRGKSYTIATAGTLIDDLPEAERVPLNQPCPPVPLWNHAGLFALLVVCFLSEWWLRRRERLV